MTCNKDDRNFLSLPPKLGGLGITIFAESCQVECESSVKLTEGLYTKITNQTRQHEANDKSLTIKNEIRSARVGRSKQQLQNTKFNLS